MKSSPIYRMRAALMAGCAAVAFAPTLAAAQQAAPEAVVAFDIPAQDLDGALTRFGQQSEREIIISAELTRNRRAPAVRGDLRPEQALRILLADSGLTYRLSNAGSIIVEAAQDPQGGSAAGASSTVEALIVTAQKREEDIQDVPIAISAFSQEDLTRSQVAGGPDLMTQVPNMTFTKTNFSGYSIQIRGIGTQAISATTDPAVAVAFNNTPFIRNRFFEQEFYDLQRVEVLRGPQGTLYGRNATAGVVNIISAKPTFQYEARLSGDVANYKSTRLEGMINLPIVEDKAALRLAGAWTKRNGYVTNEITGNPIDGRDLWSTRASLRIEPTDAISANLIYEHFEEDDDRLRSGKQLCKRHELAEIGGVPMPPLVSQPVASAPSTYSQGCAPTSLYSPDAFQTPNGYSLPYVLPLVQLGAPFFSTKDPYLSRTQSHDLRTIESTWDPQYRARSDLAELQVNVDIGAHLTLASETAYSTDTIFSLQDFNRFNTAPGAFLNDESERSSWVRDVLQNGVFCDPQLGCSDRLIAVDLSTAESRHFSQELRLASDFDGPFNFSVGANLLRYNTEDKYYVFFNTTTLAAAYSALGWRGGAGRPKVASPWIPGITDNHQCLRPGALPANPREVHNVIGCIYIDPNPIEGVNDEGRNYFLSKNPYKLISYAVFGETYYEMAPNLKVTAGLRWTVDKKEAPQIPSWLLAADSAGYPVAEVIREEWSEPTGRLTIDWKPDLIVTDETLLYAAYAHGYKAGGANPPPAVIVAYAGQDVTVGGALLEESLAHPKRFDAEFIDAFEFGAKNSLFGGGLTLNANMFYYDYKGYQISQIIDRAAINYNFDAEVWGAELEVDWRPLENLKLGLKVGYENTRVADGEQAIDVMDRTAGNPDWIVARPFPTVPSNCILPVEVVTFGDRINVYNTNQFPPPGPCAVAYQLGLDPFTQRPYEPNPTLRRNLGNGSISAIGGAWAGYPGWDPSTAPNNGEGFAKDLSGNELPNAPHYTATLTTDYSVPLPSNWLMTLHTDLYYQSEAWARVFNMEGYDKLKAYTNVNLATIFTNEDAGWNVMAYVKNVFDRDSITGSFLNSDDTGLTTNVFLTEPRLYGLRVTKEWTGGAWWSGAGREPGHPYPLKIQVGGSVQRHDAPYEPIAAGFLENFSSALDPLAAQKGNLDWGDGREVRLVYAPLGARWDLSLGARFGKTNGADKLVSTEAVETGCLAGPPYEFMCTPEYDDGANLIYPTNYSRASVGSREEHAIVDFKVGSDLGLGSSLLLESRVNIGLRYGAFLSKTEAGTVGIPDWQIPDWAFFKYSTHHWVDGDLTSRREFEGAGPLLSWDASTPLWKEEGAGRVTFDWSVLGAVLFGKQRTSVTGLEHVGYYGDIYHHEFPELVSASVTEVNRRRSKSVSVPALDLSLGLSYEVDRFKIGAGYRWERYFDALDVGDRERKDADRTIDGPYFKIAVGFGG